MWVTIDPQNITFEELCENFEVYNDMVLHSKVKAGHSIFESFTPVALARCRVADDWLHAKGQDIFFPLLNQMLIWADDDHCEILIFIFKETGNSS